MFLATINVPGYLPMDDDPPTFETAGEAWEYLADERAAWENEAGLGGSVDLHEGSTETHDTLIAHVSNPDLFSVPDVGTVYGPTPGYDHSDPAHDHDLGLAYSVSEVEDE